MLSVPSGGGGEEDVGSIASCFVVVLGSAPHRTVLCWIGYDRLLRSLMPMLSTPRQA